MTVILRDYQRDTIDKIYQAWQRGARNVCAVLPTGAGKSIIVSEIITNAFNANRSAVVIAHRNELVSQMACHIARRGIPHRIIAANNTISQITQKEKRLFGKSFVNFSASIAVIGIDTLISRAEDLKAWGKQISLWVLDESHHLLRENKWGKGVELFPNAYGLGVTATPNRADGKGLSRETDGYLDDLIIGPTSRQLIELGHLSDYEIVCPKSDLNVENVKLSADGDWCAKNLKKAAKESRIVGDVVKNYQKYANGRKAIVFATDVETADDISKSFNESGIRAASVNGASKTSWREQSIEGFIKGAIPVLVNVDLFDEGFDCPDAEVCIMARPTASLGKYLQMIGRVLRPQENKTALVIDHVSNVIRHGLPDRYRIWTLNRREKRASAIKDPETLDLKICPYCLKPYEAFRTVCPYCGQSKPLPEPRSRSIQMVDGDLVLLDKTALEKLRSQTNLESPEDIQSRVARTQGAVIGKHIAKCQKEKIDAQQTLVDAIAQWASIQRSAGFNDRELYRKFYLTTGTDVLSALSASHSRQEYQDMAELVKGWYQ